MTPRKPGRWLLKRFLAGLAVAGGLMGADFNWSLPKGFPRPSVPTDNPMTAARVELGSKFRPKPYPPLHFPSARNSGIHLESLL
jgi:hypothetical protein